MGLVFLGFLIMGVRGINELINPSYGRVQVSQAGKISKREGIPLFSLVKDGQWTPMDNGHFEGLMRDPAIKARADEFVWCAQTNNTTSDMRAAGKRPSVKYVDRESGRTVGELWDTKGTPPVLHVQGSNQQHLATFNPTVLDVPKFLELLDVASEGGPPPVWTQPTPPAEAEEDDEYGYEDDY